MRGSAWVGATVAAALFIAAVAWPVLAGAGAAWSGAGSSVEVMDPLLLLLTSLAWSAAVAAGAMVLGWVPGRVLAAAVGRRWFVPLAAAFLVPICLPAYMVFYAWWQAWPPDSAFFRWAVQREIVEAARHATLFLGLVCWSWPIVAWCVAGSGTAAGAALERLMQVDGAGPARRWSARLRRDGPGLVVGGFIVALITFSNTTCFDLAQVFTVGNELRAMLAQGPPRQVIRAALPAMALAATGAAIVWMVLQRRPRAAPSSPGTVPAGHLVAAVLIWLLSVSAPAWLAARVAEAPSALGSFWPIYGRGVVSTAALSGLAAAAAALVAVGLAFQWQDHRRWVRAAAHLQAAGWLFTALLPGPIVACALEAAYNVPLPLGLSGFSENAAGPGNPRSDTTMADLIYRTPLIVTIGYLCRFGFVAALLGRWLAGQEPATLLELRRLDSAENLAGTVRATWPGMLAAAAAVVAVVFVLGFGEIPVTAQVRPPGLEVLATSVLNDMHYQRPRTVMVAALLLMALTVGVAALLSAIAWSARRRGPVTAAAALLLAAAVLGGCGWSDGAPRPLRPEVVFGAPGLAPGQFNYPRGIAVNAARQQVFVVDKSARVQRFGFDGLPQASWRLPEKELGKPTGLNVAPDGTVFVADTHYFRVIAYDDSGRERMRFGEYGEGPGQFIYPTDVAFGPEGRLYVSEYGGNDRVQVFSDAGRYLFTFGTFGSGAGQFDRPQSLVFSADRRELFVADACNHRIVVVDPQGRVLRSFGGPGREPGRLLYPYDLTLLEDGSLVVCEFGNNRIQHFSTAGEPRGVLGRAGAGEGELQYPWGVDTADDRLFVLDSGNNRVQVIAAP